MKKIAFIFILVLVALFVAYEALILIDNHMRFGRMWETPAVKPYERVFPSMAKGAVPASGGEAQFAAMKGENLKSPLRGDNPVVIEAGKTGYSLYCAQCHGRDHDGNGTVGQSFHPLPTDLRSPKVLALPEGELFQSISYGTPNGRQPPLATTIEVLDRWRIIAYIKSLGPRM